LATNVPRQINWSKRFGFDAASHWHPHTSLLGSFSKNRHSGSFVGKLRRSVESRMERTMSAKSEKGQTPTNDDGTQTNHWVLKYGEQTYGPYTYVAMEKYISEGRVVADSQIAPEGSQAWKAAREVSVFAAYFDDKRSGNMSSTPATVEDSRPVYGTGKGQIDRRKKAETSNFIVTTDIRSRHGAAVEQAIMSLGPALKIAPNIWIVNAKTTAPGILNHLSQLIANGDALFVVDATADRTAWINYGPETDAKIRRVWRRPRGAMSTTTEHDEKNENAA
jgi:hypothetical protein